MIGLPQLNANETICTVKVYSTNSMQLLRIYKFRTAEVFKLYDTREEVAELDYDL